MDEPMSSSFCSGFDLLFVKHLPSISPLVLELVVFFYLCLALSGVKFRHRLPLGDDIRRES
jgi:hypothetical protein